MASNFPNDSLPGGGKARQLRHRGFRQEEYRKPPMPNAVPDDEGGPACPADSGASTTDSDQGTNKGKLYLSGCSPGNSFAPECEVFIEGEENKKSKMKFCEKNPGHRNLIRVKDFTKEHLPEAIRTEKMKIGMKDLIARTVLITVKCISVNRPDTYHDSECPYPYSQYKGSSRVTTTGTGYLTDRWFKDPVNGPCPCHECKESGKPQNKYWKYNVVTATHVVFDDSEAEKTVITCFYDSEEDLKDAVTLYGVSIKDERVQSQDEMYQSDFCGSLLCVTHEEKFAERISSRISWDDSLLYNTPLGVIVSHPHGGSKRISIGEILHSIIPIKPGFETGQPQLFVEEAICDVPSNSTGEIVRHHFCHTIPIERTSKDHYHEMASFTLPDDSKYAMRYHYNKGGVTFPPGTIFKSWDDTVIRVPDNAFFKTNDFLLGLSPFHEYCIVAYNIPTCPGSSGAIVPWHNNGLDSNSIIHAGVDKKERFNRSSIYNLNSVLNLEERELQTLEEIMRK